MRIRYTPRAFADREAIYEYLDRRNPRAARDVKAFIKKCINDLQYFPERYPIVKERDVRALFLSRYPYTVYYRIIGDEILILHIRHAARRPWEGAD
jgi:plasmid stabilization system protein ParE